MERKPPSETWESFADARIREAQQEGAFDALPGFGKPIPDLAGPDDPNWWIKKNCARKDSSSCPDPGGTSRRREDLGKRRPDVDGRAGSSRRSRPSTNEFAGPISRRPTARRGVCSPSMSKRSWPGGKAGGSTADFVDVNGFVRSRTVNTQAGDNQSAPAEPRDARVQAALKEYLERLDRGAVPDRESFLTEHSEIADELRSFIDAEEQLRKLARAGNAAEVTHVSTQSFALHGQETIVPRADLARLAEEGGAGLTQEFGRYRIIKALGKGAMGTVYLAEDTQLERQVG